MGDIVDLRALRAKYADNAAALLLLDQCIGLADRAARTRSPTERAALRVEVERLLHELGRDRD